jgi:hypothetical protein
LGFDPGERQDDDTEQDGTGFTPPAQRAGGRPAGVRTAVRLDGGNARADVGDDTSDRGQITATTMTARAIRCAVTET